MKKNPSLLFYIRDTIRLFTVIFFMPWWAYIIESIFNKSLTFTNAALAILMFVVFGGFWCGWLCPFGNLDYFISKIGEYLIPKRILKRFVLPKTVDEWLGYLRYFFIIPFAYAGIAVSGMFGNTLMETLGYTLARYGIHIYFLIKIVTILLIPLCMPRFFCRYVCFHRALANIINKILPMWKIQREETTCTSCSKCNTSCEMGLPISTLKHASASDCLFCFDCLDSSKSCSPRSQSLYLYFFRWRVDPTVITVIALFVYFGYYIYSVILR